MYFLKKDGVLNLLHSNVYCINFRYVFWLETMGLCTVRRQHFCTSQLYAIFALLPSTLAPQQRASPFLRMSHWTRSLKPCLQLIWIDFPPITRSIVDSNLDQLVRLSLASKLHPTMNARFMWWMTSGLALPITMR